MKKLVALVLALSMVLSLAGALAAEDGKITIWTWDPNFNIASMKEAAALDGANQWQTFSRVVFPAMKPINIVVLVVTVIEGLRAFDIVYIINKGTNGLELLSVLITNNIVGEASRIGFGSAIAVVLLLISLAFIITYLVQTFRKESA